MPNSLSTDYEMWDFSACSVKSLACVRKSDATTVGTTTPKRTLRRSFCAHVRSFHTSVLSATSDDRIKHNEGGPAKDGQNSHSSQEMSRHLNNLHLNVQLQSQQYPSISVLIRLGLQSHFEGRQHCRVHQEQTWQIQKHSLHRMASPMYSLESLMRHQSSLQKSSVFHSQTTMALQSPMTAIASVCPGAVGESSAHFWCTSRKQPFLLTQTQSGILRVQRSQRGCAPHTGL